MCCYMCGPSNQPMHSARLGSLHTPSTQQTTVITIAPMRTVLATPPCRQHLGPGTAAPTWPACPWSPAPSTHSITHVLGHEGAEEA